jgi:hypothetical protein
LDFEGIKNKVTVIEQVDKEKKALLDEQLKALQAEIKDLRKPVVKP